MLTYLRKRKKVKYLLHRACMLHMTEVFGICTEFSMGMDRFARTATTACFVAQLSAVLGTSSSPRAAPPPVEVVPKLACLRLLKRQPWDVPRVSMPLERPPARVATPSHAVCRSSFCLLYMIFLQYLKGVKLGKGAMHGVRESRKTSHDSHAIV